MKKQIALFATIIAASSFAAFGQGYLTMSTVTHDVFDEFTTSGVGANDTLMDVALLWAPSGTADNLALVNGSGGPAGDTAAQGERGLATGGAVGNQVATNGVTSVGSANPISTITTMLGAGWNLAQNASIGSAGVGTNAMGTTLLAGNISYTGGIGGTAQFQVGGTTSGEVIELIAIAWNASATSWSTASDIGWSNGANYTTGTSQSDLNGQTALNAAGENQFGVASVPEPTTLALAGLGGLSMLFLRRRNS